MNLVEATLAVDRAKVQLAEAEEALQEAEAEFMWKKGCFRPRSIPGMFSYCHESGLTENVLSAWKEYGYGPQPNENGVYSIAEMHEFFWCTELDQLPPDWRGDDYWRKYFATARLDKLKSWITDIDHLIFAVRRKLGDAPAKSRKWSGRPFPSDQFKKYKEKLPMFKTTSDLRSAMIKLYGDVEKGHVTASVARTKVAVAKTIVDTLKVEIAAANLGRQFGTVRFDEIEEAPTIKRVA